MASGQAVDTEVLPWDQEPSEIASGQGAIQYD
jgi:hypothetical protein